MTWSSLMVSMDLGQSNEAVLEVARGLAQRFDAGVIGVAGAHPMQMVYADGYAAGDIYELETREIAAEMATAQAAFRKALEARGDKLSWRATEKFESIADFATRQARSADLLITGVPTGDFFGTSRAIHAADLIMNAGRPVLVVPAGDAETRFDIVIVAWKDTREARRAIVDALPLLKRALRVVVVELAPQPQLRDAHARVDDVVQWLAGHGVTAQPVVDELNPDAGDQLGSVATEHGGDLVVAGAYGHSRLREWVLGGVTRSLLHGGQRCCLLSH